MSAQLAMNFAPICQKRRGSYYVSTPLTPDQYVGALAAAANQDEIVFAIYRRYADTCLTPSQCHSIIAKTHPEWEKGSIRRSITTLTKDGLLEKTAVTVLGPKGRPEHAWRLPARAAA
jgi:hypothetical protein